jgi:hypothetical protein
MVVRLVFFLVGLATAAAAVALLLAPRWFFDNVAPIAPYNRHFMGDAGAYSLAVGAALLVAAWDPVRFRLLALLGIGGTVVHALNHVYGSIFAGEIWVSTILVVVEAVALLACVPRLRAVA